MQNFNVIYRNYGHWDICNDKGRIYRIRGGPGRYKLYKEGKCKLFKTVNACMAYVCDQLMYELIIAEGQKPQMIESWNV